jgi:RES domain-containing protein
MEFWRICKQRHVESALSGVGAERIGGRWNHKGYAVIYASENLSLATLELFVHAAPSMLPTDLVAVCASLPDSVSTAVIDVKDLPATWKNYPAADELKNIGSKWIEDQSSLVLKVPSAINEQEQNLLINPQHKDIAKLKIVKTIPFQFDPRMFKK